MYRVIEAFEDATDNRYRYAVGDTYPRKGFTPPKERISALASDGNVRKRPLIEAVRKQPEKKAK